MRSPSKARLLGRSHGAGNGSGCYENGRSPSGPIVITTLPGYPVDRSRRDRWPPARRHEESQPAESHEIGHWTIPGARVHAVHVRRPLPTQIRSPSALQNPAGPGPGRAIFCKPGGRLRRPPLPERHAPAVAPQALIDRALQERRHLRAVTLSFGLNVVAVVPLVTPRTYASMMPWQKTSPTPAHVGERKRVGRRIRRSVARHVPQRRSRRTPRPG